MERTSETTIDRGFDKALFRRVMGSFASGVTVITSRDGETVHGMTANAFMSGSLEPPLVVVSIAKRASMQHVIRSSGHFGINILGERQVTHSRHFAGQTKLADAPQFEWREGVPLLADGLASVAAHVEAIHPCGDHDLFIGKVRHVGCSNGFPLLYFKGEYLPANSEGNISGLQAWV